MRSVPRQMPVGGMQRMQPQGMPAYNNLTSQAGMGVGMNPGGIPMQRGVSAQTHQQQQVYCVESLSFCDQMIPISDAPFFLSS
jgi:hypothetical protein